MSSKSTARLSVFLVATLFALTVAAEELLQQGRVVLAGYGDVGYVDAEEGDSSFTANFVPILLYQLSDRIHIEAEIEFSVDEDGATETELEYADIHYYLSDRLTLTAGKFLLPFGQFGQNLHPSWINRLPTFPGIYGGHHGVGGLMDPLVPILNDTGVALQYVGNIGDMRLTFDAFVSNGPRLADAGHDEGEEADHAEEAGHEANEPGHDLAGIPGFPDIAIDGRDSDNNSDKAFGGRVGLALYPHVELGLSYMRGDYDDRGELTYTAKGVDFYVDAGPVSLRGEYIDVQADALDDGLKSTVNRDGWYLQGSWELWHLDIDPLNPIELVVRTSRTQEIDKADRWTFGINYWMRPNAVLKLAWERTKLDDRNAHIRNENRFFAQLAYGF